MNETANPYFLLEMGPLLLTTLIVVLVVVFVLWLALFLLNRVLDFSHDVPSERRWTVARQLTFGFSILCLVALLIIIQSTVYHRSYDLTQVLPTYVQAP
mgnify:CR=1 FL=1